MGNQTLRTILKRRSIRAYKSEQITDEELQTIIEAGVYAPNGMNRQSWHFSAVQNKETLAKIDSYVKRSISPEYRERMLQRSGGKDFSIFYYAPTLIVVSGDPKDNLAQADCALALGSMFLAACSLGIGSCWINYVGIALNASDEGRAMAKEIGVPGGYVIYGSGAFGYPAQALPKPASRKAGTINIIR